VVPDPHAAPQQPDRAAIERAVRDLLHALRLDGREHCELERTPARIAEFYAEAFAGLDPSRAPELATFAREGGDALVVLRDLEFHSLCVHHFAPFFGTATIAYLPDALATGISTPARLLDWYARRPQLQERLTAQIADHLERLIAPRGVAVIIRARHLCMEMRGIRRRGMVETRVVRGALAEPQWAKAIETAERAAT